MWLEIHNVVTKIINSMAVSKQFTDFLSYFSQKFSQYCFLSTALSFKMKMKDIAPLIRFG